VKLGLELTDAVRASLIVPTLFRPTYLRRCLSALASQTLPPDEVLAGVRADDDESDDIVKQFADRIRVYAIEAKGVGVVGSMNSCLEAARGDFIGFLDDDVEVPPFWLEIMLRHLQQHENVLGVGARDLLQDHPEMRAAEPLTDDVGRFHWFGRISGNHHRAGGEPREVDLLRGSNCLFRGDFLRSARFESGLRGQGAQVNWELALALKAQRLGKRLYFDPSVKVIHHVAPRQDNDQMHRGRFSYDAALDIAYNEAFVVYRHASGPFRVTAVLWQLLVGSPGAPGMLATIRAAAKRQSNPLHRLEASLTGKYLAAKTCLGLIYPRFLRLNRER
jgi:GT2 family glycosyltransferase